MKVLKFNRKDGFAHLQITSQDDLWYLSSLIEPHDHLASKTERKVKLGGGDERKSVISKRTVTLTVDVEKAEWSSSDFALRVSGKIIDGPEDIPRGSYHTLTLEMH